MKTFFNEWKVSLIDGGWYKNIIAGKVPLKIRYALILSCIGALVMSCGFGIILYRDLLPGFKTFAQKTIPDDLVVTLKSGELSINRPSPYKIPLTGEEKIPNKENLVVIDTTAEATLSSPSLYKTAIFSNSKMFVTEKENGEIRAFSYKDFPDFVFTKNKVIEHIDSAFSYAWLIALVILVPITLFSFAQMLLIFLVSAVLLWVIFKIASRETTFKNLFTASMYAYTVIFSANILLSIFSMRTFGFLPAIVLSTVIAVFFIFVSKQEGREISY